MKRKPKTVRLWVAASENDDEWLLFSQKPARDKYDESGWRVIDNFCNVPHYLLNMCAAKARRYLGLSLAPGECCRVEITTRRIGEDT
jgi:hypothetical protein